MEAVPIEVEPEQLVQWLVDEQEQPDFRLRITATRVVERRPFSARDGGRLGDVEREDLDEVATVATLQVRPAASAPQWSIVIVVEDEAGPRVPEIGDVPAEEEEIDLETFHQEYIRAERGIAMISAEADGPGAKAALTRLVHAIETNVHRRF